MRTPRPDVEGVAEAGDEVGGVGLGEAVAHDHELVAADAADGVGAAGHRREELGHLHQQLVAAGVAVGVVHRLEAVEVAVDRGERAAGEAGLDLLEQRRPG